ncbi:hypothetical protein BH23ACT2_BH23ACT2_30450 [soil metagenome]
MPSTDPHEPPDAPSPADAPPSPGRLATAMGPLTGLRVVVLLVAVAFLAASVGWAVGQRPEDPLTGTDVGFLREMGYHHEQGIELSLILLYKDEVDQGLDAFAQEIIIGQRFEQGLFNAILDRFGHDVAVDPDGEVMGWMGRPIAAEQMPGLASADELQALEGATGSEAEALWIALMTEHHLGGLHMADWAARHGGDRTTVNLAERVVEIQRSEVIDLDRYRQRNSLPIPDGFANPMEDQRLNPLSLTES